jgi:bacillopeptidase F
VVFVPLCMALASLFSSCGDGSINSPPDARSHSVVLTWDASTSTDVVGYNVYRSGSSGGPYAQLNASIPVDTLTYTDTTVQAGLIHYFVVTAVDWEGNESAYSNEASALVPSP